MASMKRVFHLLLTLLLALMVIAAFSAAAATKPKTVGKKTLVTAAPTEAVQQAEHLQTQSSTTLPHIPTIQTVQELGDEDESDADIPQHLRGRVNKAEYLRL